MPGGGYQGHRSDEWTDFELQTLYDHAGDPHYMRVLPNLLPGRSPNAIRQRMCALRRECGMRGGGQLQLVAPDYELMRKLEGELIGGQLAECRRLRHEERATAACHDRRPGTSEE